MLKSPKLNILIAFPYFSQANYANLMARDPSSFRLIVDSGAFTAWNTGKKILMEDYCKFLKTVPSHWDYKAVQFDVYGDPEKTYTNYYKMLDMGFTDVMPVFTRGDTVERLDEFYTHTNYIMFGGIAIGGSNRNYVKWFNQVNKGRDTHWLGFVNMPFIKHYKPYSVDSSSLFSAARFGNLQYYVGQGNLKSVHRTDFVKKPDRVVIDSLVKTGFTHQEIALLANQDAWEGSSAPYDGVNIRGLASFMTITSHVKRAVEIERNIGTKVYLAVGNKEQINCVFQSLELLKSKKLI